MGHTVSMMSTADLKGDPQRAITCHFESINTNVAVHMNITQVCDYYDA